VQYHPPFVSVDFLNYIAFVGGREREREYKRERERKTVMPVVKPHVACLLFS
jgi:hypothetical protein